MSRIIRNLSIGEKIGFGFGLVGLIFLVVIWQYHDTLRQSMGEFQRLQDVYVAQKIDMLSIESSMRGAGQSEKEFLLYRDEAAAEGVESQLQQALSTAADLGGIDPESTPVATRIIELLEIYQRKFQAVVQGWRKMGLDHNSGLQGRFRDVAHELEAMAGRFDGERSGLQERPVSGLAIHILQLRRREKDYLLRHDKKYVDMALHELNRIQVMVEQPAVPTDQKAQFLSLLKNYRHDFLALVDQNDRIDRMTEEMHEAVSEITGLVRENVAIANQVMERMEREIRVSSDKKERFMLWSVALATLLGIGFAVFITLRIVRPLRDMVGMLDRLAYEEPTERLPFYPGARDEVNAMAGSVNTMADNKSRFIAWWKSSMAEAGACENLESVLNKTAGDPQRQEAEREFREALVSRHELLFQQYHKLYGLNGEVVEQVEMLQKEGHSGQTQISLNNIRYSSRSMQNILEMIAFQNNKKRAG